MKKKLIYTSLVIAVLISVAFVPINSVFATNSKSSKNKTPEEKGKIILKYTAPETDWDSATKKEKVTLKKIGWELENGVLVQYRSIPDEIEEAIKNEYLPEEEIEIMNLNEDHSEHENHQKTEDTLIVDGKKTEINDGRFEVKGNPQKITVESDENTKQTIKRDKNGEYELILEQNLNEIIGNMDDHSGHEEMSTLNASTLAYGQTYKKGDWVHCNRFNGPKSNNKHLEKWKPQAVINFYHSDCDYGALRYCKSHKNCNQKYRAAYCSWKLGHSEKYHKHKK